MAALLETTMLTKKEVASLFETFDESGSPDPVKAGFTMLVDDQPSPTVPQISAQYAFRKDALRELLGFLKLPYGDALFITGPTGSGKTSLILETAARLNWGVRMINCNARFEFASLLGSFRLEADAPGAIPTMRFQKGALPLAMENGEILLLNEVDLADPGEISGLNDILEGRPLVLSDNGGEVIHPSPRFRIIVTGNSAGSGDDTGRYEGVRPMNIAFMDRFRVLEVGYAPAKIEENILLKAVPALGQFIPQMVELANYIRKSFEMGDSSVTMSTRTLVRWARLANIYRKAPCPLKQALSIALLRRARPHEREAILSECQLIFKQAWPEK